MSTKPHCFLHPSEPLLLKNTLTVNTRQLGLTKLPPFPEPWLKPPCQFATTSGLHCTRYVLAGTLVLGA